MIEYFFFCKNINSNECYIVFVCDIVRYYCCYNFFYICIFVYYINCLIFFNNFEFFYIFKCEYWLLI